MWVSLLVTCEWVMVIKITSMHIRYWYARWLRLRPLTHWYTDGTELVNGLPLKLTSLPSASSLLGKGL